MTELPSVPRPPGPFDADLPTKPYPGLRPFQSEEWPIFFGREPMTDRVIDLVIGNRMVVVHGDSGCGKSSLVRAGVLVQLQQGHAATGGRWRHTTLLPREDPLGNLAQALAKLDCNGADPGPRLTGDLREILNEGSYAPETVASLLRRDENDHICILIDQFEELFRYARQESRTEAACLAEFLTSLANEPPPGLYVILTMRSEFLGHCAWFKGFAEAVNRTQYLLPKMEEPDLRRAIREPARLYNGRITEELAERLIQDAGGGQDQLPLIQLGLMLLWQRKLDQRTGSGKASEMELAWDVELVDYSASGGLATLLSDHADEVMAEVAPDEPRQRIVEQMFRALTEINAEGQATRRPQTVARLQAITGSNQATLAAIMAGFRTEGVSFLSPFGVAPISDDQQVDISHEALIRCWQQIADPEDGWLQRDFRDGLIWKTLLVQADRDEVLSPAAASDRAAWIESGPSEAWAKRYGGGWGRVKALIDRSTEEARKREEERQRETRERIKRAEEFAKAQAELKEEQHQRAEDAIRSQRRQRWWTMVTAAVAMIALVAAFLAWSESQRADVAAQVARSAQKSAEDAQSQAEQRRDEALRAEERAETAAEKARIALREQRVATSKMFAALADAETERGDTTKALSLAVRGLPRTLGNVSEWPDTPEAARALYRAAQAHRFERLILSGSRRRIWSVAFSPGGRRIASASADKTVRIWDAESGQETARLEGHGGEVNSVAFSPEGRWIASGSDDKTVRIWDPESGRETVRLEGHEDLVWSVAFSPDGRRIASASSDETVRIWDLGSGQQTARLEGHDGSVRSVAFSPDGHRIASASSDGTVRIWDLGSGQETAHLEGHDGSVRSVAFSPDGRRIASASSDGTVRIWDLGIGQETARLEGHGGEVYSVAFSPNGHRIASGSDDNRVRIWDLESRQETALVKGHGQTVFSVAFSPDGRRIASASADKTVRIWDIASVQEPSRLEGHEGLVWSVVFSPDGRRIASASRDKTVRIWDAERGQEIARLEGHDKTVWSVVFSPDGRRIASASADQTVRTWDAESGQETARLEGHGDAVHSVAFSPNGRRIASASEDKTVRIWDLESGQETARFEGHDGLVWSVAFSPNGRRIASASEDETVRIWDLESGHETARLEGHANHIFLVAFSPNGRRIASASADTTVRIWDAESGQEITRLEGHGDAVNSVAFSPNGRQIASASEDKTVRIWDLESAQEISRLEGHDQGFSSVTFSPDGHQIASGSEDKTVRLWKSPPYQSPETLIAMAISEEGISSLARQGQAELALSHLKWLRMDPRRTVSPQTLNEVCWFGAINGHAERVLGTCEAAVLNAPDQLTFREVRAVVLALMDETDRAIDEFEAIVAGSEDSEFIKERGRWIEELRSGRDPFTPEFLEQLTNNWH